MPPLLNANLVYDAADRLPETQLPVVLQALRAWAGPQQRTVAIYGMGQAGEKLRRALDGDPQFTVPANFDARGDALKGQGTICTPDRIAQFPHIALVINTTPPIHLLDVATTIRRALSQCAILSLYNPFAHMHAEHLYFEYWSATSAPRETSEEIRRLSDELREACVIAMHGWYDAAGAASPHCPPSAAPASHRDPRTDLRAALAAKQCSFGQYLEAELQEALRMPSGEKIDALTILAETFPFFVLPRDAAATELAQRGRHRQAAALFAPALSRYPYCHHTLTKAAELQIMAENVTQAMALLNKARDVMPRSRKINTLLREIGSAQGARRVKDLVEAKWHRRILRQIPKLRTTKIRIITPIWGEKHIDTFMKVTLASLLADGNLPQTGKTHEICYTIYTKKADAATLRRHVQYKALTDCVPVEVCFIEDVLEQSQWQNNHKYSLMSTLQTDGLRRAFHDGAHSFLLLGDFILSNKFLTYALHHLDQGANTLFFQSLRTCEERILQDVASRFSCQEQLSLTTADLFRHGQQHMHPAYRKHFMPNQVMRTPNSLYARNAAGDIIQHAFAQNAMFVGPCDENIEIHMTLDVDLGYNSADAGLGNYHLVPDNREMLFFELTQEHEEAGTHFAGKPDYKAYAYWVHRHMNPLNRYLGTFSTIFTGSDVRPAFCNTQLDLSCAISRLLV
ncbi:MAG: tetratricopeptide repeat protein [Solidesulfovibrio sp.]